METLAKKSKKLTLGQNFFHFRLGKEEELIWQAYIKNLTPVYFSPLVARLRRLPEQEGGVRRGLSCISLLYN